MKLAIVGSRDFLDYPWMEHCLLQTFRVEDIETIVSGGARGADSLAERFAARQGLPIVVIPAEWNKYGRRAGPLRNTEIVNSVDALAAFWDGVSRGTRDVIGKARAAGRFVTVFPCDRGAWREDEDY